MFLCFQNTVSSKDLLPAHENLDNTDFSVADKKNMLALIGGLHSVVLNCILDRSQHKCDINLIFFLNAHSWPDCAQLIERFFFERKNLFIIFYQNIATYSSSEMTFHLGWSDKSLLLLNPSPWSTWLHSVQIMKVRKVFVALLLLLQVLSQPIVALLLQAIFLMLCSRWPETALSQASTVRASSYQRAWTRYAV